LNLVADSCASTRLRVVSWEKLVSDVERLAEAVKGRDFDAIVAVARGGLVIARLLSDMLDVKRILTLQVEYYEDIGKRKSRPSIIGGLGSEVVGMSLLVVDDIADTGDTLKTVVEYLKSAGAANIVTCTLYVKPWCTYKPDHYVETVEEWVVFPYEHAETARTLLEEGWSYQQLLNEGIRGSILAVADRTLRGKH